MKGETRFTVSVSDDVNSELDRMASACGLTKAQYIRNAILLMNTISAMHDATFVVQRDGNSPVIVYIPGVTKI